MIVENPLNQGKTLNGAGGVELGLADACFSGADFLEQSLLLGRRRARRRGHRRAARGRPRRGAGTPPSRAAEQVALAKTGGASPAAQKAVELIAAARTATRDEGFAAEDDALEAMSRTPELIASAVRLRPGAEAGQAARRRARQVAGARRSPRSASSAPA